MAGSAILAACLAAPAFDARVASAGSLADYRLLVLNGQKTKWGSPVLGTGVALTYAVASSPLHTDDAINCTDIDPVDGLLSANRLKSRDFNRELDAAFAAWAAVADVTFARVTDPARADIVIGAESESRGRAFTNVATARTLIGSDGAAPAAYAASAQPGTITRSLICLNAGQPWKIGFDGNLKVYDIRYALMHEIGHAIGLDHPETPNSVMDFRYTEAFLGLQPGDIAGARALYGSRMVILRAASPAAPLQVHGDR